MSARQVSAKQTSAKQAPAKKTPNLKAFIEKVNKKDRPNGLKIRFAFVKRKRR